MNWIPLHHPVHGFLPPVRRKHLHPKEVRLRWMEHDESSVKQVIFWDFLKQRQRTEEGMFSSCCQRFTIVLACNGCEDMFLVFVV